MILKNILKTKTVSVWGLGYLGYTTILKLQNSGFNVLVYDFNPSQKDLFLNGKYPSDDQAVAWSRTGYLPELNSSRIKFARTLDELFACSHLHIIAIPENYKNSAESSIAGKLAAIFAKNLKGSKIKPLIIFESAFIPGHIEKNFAGRLEKENLHCSQDFYLGVLFRTDWNIEAFINQSDKMLIAGYCPKSLEAIKEVTSYLSIPVAGLKNIKEAEIYINSFSAIQAMVNDFTRQLAMGYPYANIKEVSHSLFKNIRFDDCVLNLGTGGTRMTFAIDYLINGSDNPNSLTLLKEFQDINISSALSYAEYIIRRAYKSVTILGLSYKGNQKDLILSPSITLADYLINNSVKVFVNDPFLTKDEIRKFIKKTEIVEFPRNAFSTDVLILAADHDEYKFLSQSMLDNIRKKTRLVIDNYGAWSHLSFGSKIKYHEVGDGTLNISK